VANTKLESLPGVKSVYRPKVGSPISVKFTNNGIGKLDRTKARTKLSAADIFEYLLDHFGDKVPTRAQLDILLSK
jgi:hypothetical protein